MRYKYYKDVDTWLPIIVDTKTGVVHIHDIPDNKWRTSELGTVRSSEIKSNGEDRLDNPPDDESGDLEELKFLIAL